MDSDAGVEGNARLTAMTAVVLLVLLAVEGLTILLLRPLLSVHVFVGMLLIPPVALKASTTGWRFLRYYTRRPEYLRRGPPPALLRLLVAPAVVVSTLVLFGTGVALLVAGPAGGIVLGLHKASFVVWFFAMSAHVLAHALRLRSSALADLRASARVRGAAARLAVVAVALGAGVALAAGTVHLAQPWIHWAQAQASE